MPTTGFVDKQLENCLLTSSIAKRQKSMYPYELIYGVMVLVTQYSILVFHTDNKNTSPILQGRSSICL